MSTVNAAMPALDLMNTNNVPVLAPDAPHLLTALTNEAIDFPDLAQIIERFPSIAGRLISLANSPWSSPVNTITSLDLACSRLGFSVVKSTSIALAVSSPFNPSRCPGFLTEHFWTHALMTADGASWLAQESTMGEPPDASTARAAGLLHSLGLLWLVDQLPDTVDQAFARRKENPANSLEATLFEMIGFTQSDAGGYLANAWKLPEPLIATMAHYSEPEFQGPHWEAASLVGLAASMVSALQRNTPWPESDGRLTKLGIAPSCADKIFCKLTHQIEKIQGLAQTLFTRPNRG